MNILITSGGTKIPIDRVRHIANMSSGTFGSKIAHEALKLNHNVNFLCAKNSKTPFTVNTNFANLKRDDVIKVMTRIENIKFDLFQYRNQYIEWTYDNFESYATELERFIKQTVPDVIILAAAVSDYGVDNYVDGKIRSKDTDMTIRLKQLPKIISRVKTWAPDAVLVGFKLLVDSTDDELIANAYKSIKDNSCDMVVANDLRDMQNNAHRLIIVKSDGFAETHQTDPNDENALARVVVTEATKVRKG
jgi:phosphopantothenate---cysteine ligase (CTP)